MLGTIKTLRKMRKYQGGWRQAGKSDYRRGAQASKRSRHGVMLAKVFQEQLWEAKSTGNPPGAEKILMGLVTSSGKIRSQLRAKALPVEEFGEVGILIRNS